MYEPALTTWRKATDLLVPIYALTNQFPKDELVARINQLRGAAVGIALNLAEGLRCVSEKDVKRFLDSSLQSARDCIEELKIAHRLDLCPRRELEAALAQAEEVAQSLNLLINNLGQHFNK